MPPASASGGSGEAQPRPQAAASGALPGGASRIDREGEDEERLGGLLEGGLGEVGGGEVGEGDHRRGERAAARRAARRRAPSAVSPVRTPIATISPTKAWPSPIPGTAAVATASPCGPSG